MKIVNDCPANISPIYLGDNFLTTIKHLVVVWDWMEKTDTQLKASVEALHLRSRTEAGYPRSTYAPGLHDETIAS